MSSKRAKSNRDALEYLLRYETMVRQQEVEELATLDHVVPCIERVQQLSGTSSTFEKEESKLCSIYGSSKDHLLSQEVPFTYLKRALFALETSHSKRDCMLTDRQLMMTLQLLTQNVDVNDSEEVSITWAEFVQCYKLVITSMLTLQHVSAPSTARSRIRDRTLAIVSLFEPACTKKLDKNAVDTSALMERVRPSTLVEQKHKSQQEIAELKREFKKNHAWTLMIGAILGISIFYALTGRRPAKLNGGIYERPMTTQEVAIVRKEANEKCTFIGVEHAIHDPLEAIDSLRACQFDDGRSHSVPKITDDSFFAPRSHVQVKRVPPSQVIFPSHQHSPTKTNSSLSPVMFTGGLATAVSMPHVVTAIKNAWPVLSSCMSQAVAMIANATPSVFVTLAFLTGASLAFQGFWSLIAGRFKM